MLYILSQIFVSVSSLIFATSLLLNSKKKLMLLQIFSTMLFTLHYFLLGAYLGGLIAIVDFARIITCYIIDKLNGSTLNKRIWCIIYIILGLIGSVFTWESWYSMFPIISLIVVNLSLTLDNLIIVKLSFNISLICTVLYMLFIASYFGLITQAIVLIIGIIGTIKQFKEYKNKAIIY